MSGSVDVLVARLIEHELAAMTVEPAATAAHGRPGRRCRQHGIDPGASNWR